MPVPKEQVHSALVNAYSDQIRYGERLGILKGVGPRNAITWNVAIDANQSGVSRESGSVVSRGLAPLTEPLVCVCMCVFKTKSSATITRLVAARVAMAARWRRWREWGQRWRGL